MGLFEICKSVSYLVLYVANFGTDINASVLFLDNGDYWWGGLTLLFAILPMITMGIINITIFTINNENTPCANDPLWGKCLWLLFAIISVPFLPIGILLWGVFDIIMDKKPDDGYSQTDGARLATTVKLCVTMVQSLPQASLQLYIVFQIKHIDDSVKIWQWATIVVSIVAFVFGVINYYDDAYGVKVDLIIKMIWLTFGALGFSSRLLVASVYSMVLRPLWFVPIVTHLVSVGLRMFGEMCSDACFRDRPLDDVSLWNILNLAIWLSLMLFLNVTYNAFSMNGLIVSSINLGFAIGSCFLDVPSHISSIALTMSAVSLGANVAFATLHQFKSVTKVYYISSIIHSEKCHSTDCSDLQCNKEIV